MTLICALCSVCCATMMINNIAALLPDYLENKKDWVGPDIKLSSMEISYILSVYALA